MWKYLHT